MEMNVYQKLCAIQTELKAPKNLYNSFGNYKYRNAEGILEALKPLLKKYNCTVILKDDIDIRGSGKSHKTITNNGAEEISDVEMTMNYIKATAYFINCEDGKEVSTTAYARECEHKGMSKDQCTGTASSYARKYCLNGLFLLDDTKDSDTDEIKNIENAYQKNSQTGWGNYQKR